MRWTDYLRLFRVFFVFFCLVAAAMACSAPVSTGQLVLSPANEPTITSVVIGQVGPAQAAVSTPAPAILQDNPAGPALPDMEAKYLGDTTRSSGYALTANAVQDPAQPGTLYQPKPGTRLVAVDITIANILRDSLIVNPLNTALVDMNGKQYPLSLAAVGNQLDTLILKKGEKVRGWVAFQVPHDAQPAAVAYGTGLASFKVLRASLVPPPPGYQPGAAQAATTPTANSPEAQTFLGDAVEKDGIAIVPISVQDPAQPSQFYKAKNDTKLVAVEMVIANVSSEAVRVSPINAVLVDTGGYNYKVQLGAVDHQIPTLLLLPGEHAQGWVAFETPLNASVASIKYLLQNASEDAIQAGLMQAPYGRASILLPASPPPPSLPKMGERVENAGYALMVSALQDPATPGKLYKPRDGYRLVAVDITVENMSGSQVTVNPLSAFLVDSLGFVYQASLSGIDNQINVMAINPGEKVEGWVAFEIPGGDKPASIKYAVDTSQNVVLQESFEK